MRRVEVGRAHVRTVRLVAALVCIAVAVAGCAGDAESSDTGQSAPSTPAPTLAGVPPCPTSDADIEPAIDGLPDLTLPCLTAGPDVRLSGLRGTPLVVNVWASWCPPCRDEFPFLVDLQSRARGDLSVLGIDLLDRDDPARAATEDFDHNYPSVVDADGSTRSPLNIQAPPVTYFVDLDGSIVHTKVGAVTSQEQLDALVLEHLGIEVPA